MIIRPPFDRKRRPESDPRDPRYHMGSESRHPKEPRMTSSDSPYTPSPTYSSAVAVSGKVSNSLPAPSQFGSHLLMAPPVVRREHPVATHSVIPPPVTAAGHLPPSSSYSSLPPPPPVQHWKTKRAINRSWRTVAICAIPAAGCRHSARSWKV